jgi:asparagine synthase (glutamine-hydrolysing)
MCGIVGIISQTPVSQHNSLLAMRDALLHRGPDDGGIWWSRDKRVGLAHRRLAIIDLSSGGHQPMMDYSGQVCIVFNGEIYNYRELRRELETNGHRFNSVSDTEVILGAYREWGIECLSHLNGMFAFCLYDSTRQRLFLARDRAGEKPLFYYHNSGKLVFASELKALMADPAFPRELDLNALNYYLAYGYVPGNMCLLKGVHKLAQGQAMTYELDTDRLHTWRYWQLPEPAVQPNISADELTEELESLLEDSVQRQLIADVPVGILLSGGIDSSLITAMAARVSSSPVKTFTISFAGHSAYDEGPYARLVADYFGTQHTELIAEPSSSVEILPKLAQQYDEPIADHAIVPTYLVSQLIRQHATVALGGDGGDELFGGYGHYAWIQRQKPLRRFMPNFLRQWIGATADRMLPIGLRGRNHLIGLAGDLSNSIAHVNLYFDRSSRQRLLSPVMGKAIFQSTPETYKANLCLTGHTAIRQATGADFMTTMVDGYLVKVDRASMLASLEIRVPWLDYRLIEFAFSRVPDILKITEKERKILPRRLAQRLLPSTLDINRKQGFTMPLATWFHGEWGTYMESVLREAEPHIFDQRMVQDMITAQHRGYANIQRLFALTMFELWRREYRVSLPS